MLACLKEVGWDPHLFKIGLDSKTDDVTQTPKEFEKVYYLHMEVF